MACPLLWAAIKIELAGLRKCLFYSENDVTVTSVSHIMAGKQLAWIRHEEITSVVSLCIGLMQKCLCNQFLTSARLPHCHRATSPAEIA